MLICILNSKFTLFIILVSNFLCLFVFVFFSGKAGRYLFAFVTDSSEFNVGLYVLGLIAKN